MAKDIIIATETNFRTFFSEEILDKRFIVKKDGKKFIIHTPINKNKTIGSLSSPKNFKIRGNYNFGTKWDSNSNRISIGAIIIEASSNEDDEVNAFSELSAEIDRYLRLFDD